MFKRFTILAGLAALIATPALAQTPPAAAPSAPVAATAPSTPAAIPVAEARKPVTVKVAIVTTAGPIMLELEKERAPITTNNFLRYVDQKRFDGMSFYRAVTVAGTPDYGILQGGTNNDPKRTLPPIAHEPTLKTGLAHVSGTVSMGRNAPGTAAGDFFIIVGDMPYMDADPTKPGDNLGYAAFGHVIEGMDVVKQMLVAPTSQTKGVGVMKGQMIENPIMIISARRVLAPGEAPPKPEAAAKPATPAKPAAKKPATPAKPTKR